VREASLAQHQKYKGKPLERSMDFQTRGWIRKDLGPEEVRREIFSAVHAAVLAILAASTPEEERRQLAAIDRVLESLAADDGSVE
jgi:hypothetical protein